MQTVSVWSSSSSWYVLSGQGSHLLAVVFRKWPAWHVAETVVVVETVVEEVVVEEVVVALVVVEGALVVQEHRLTCWDRQLHLDQMHPSAGSARLLLALGQLVA